jgi:hypothetical protein
MKKRLLSLTLSTLIFMSSLLMSTTTSSAVSKEYVSNISKETNIEYVYNEKGMDNKVKVYLASYYKNFMEIILCTVNL